MNPVMTIKALIGVLLIAQISACSLFGHKRACTGEDCYKPQVLEQSSAAHKWYCYGQESGSWDCLSKPDKQKIVAIKPKMEAPVNPDQVPGTSTPVMAHSNVPSRPLTNITHSFLDQSDKSYTVQLTASRNEQDLTEFIQEHNVINPVYVVVPGDNGPTYILVLGIYKDQDKAIAARSFWERTRRVEEEPWVRKVGPLQKAIQAKDHDG